MADPILIDDGGSTRIKQLKSATASSKLDELVDNDQAKAAGRFTKVKVVYVDPSGITHDPGFTDLKGRDVEIQAEHTNLVTLKIEPNNPNQGDYECTIVPPTNGQVDCKVAMPQKQRRYVITNAGAITKVVLGGALQLFPPLVGFGGSQYTMVYLT